MRKKTKAKTKEITKMVLSLLAEGFMTYAAFGSSRAVGRYGKILDSFADESAWIIKRALQRLKMQDMIQYDGEDEKSTIVLTEKGMARVARYKLRDLFEKKKKWDYFWRIVFFDVPEEKKHLRNTLRKALLATGFYPFQKSVFVCPLDCEDVIKNFCRFYKISNHVLFCVTPSLGVKEGEVRKFFFSRSKH